MKGIGAKKILFLVGALLIWSCSGNGEDLPGDGDGDVEVNQENNQGAREDGRLDGEGEPCRLYDQRGPFGVGVVDRILDGGEEVAIFYPAHDQGPEPHVARYDMRDFLPASEREKISDEDSPQFEMSALLDMELSSDGPFPVILFSHGLGGYRYQSSELLSHLASWGFVVLSAEHPERNLAYILENMAPQEDNTADTLRVLMDYLRSENQRSDGFFEGALDLERVGVSGHSMGGAGAASMLGEEGVQAAIFYASARTITENHGAQVMWQSGSTDRLATSVQVRDAYSGAPAVARFLDIKGAGHLAFADLCAIEPDRGGPLQIAIDNDINVPPIIRVLASDGCRDTDLDVELAWPIIHHYSVAHYRSAFGIDAEPVGMSAATTTCFEDFAELDWRAQESE